ncbi:MAG: ABC transporter ATP-binding protein [Methylobacteriaceae bacterium]|nr:ABC transporter ATP-binding protein [Methylobacteriaceae bacterium]
MSALLRVERVSKNFGGLVASRNVSLALESGDRVALIGPNGAGKTTLVNMIAGLLPLSAGRVMFAGQDVARVSAVARVRMGLVRTFQISRLFPDLTSREHLGLAVLQRQRRTGHLFRRFEAMAEVQREIDGLLAELGIEALGGRAAGALAYGEQRLVEIAIALALQPRVLLLDEPAAGVPQGETRRIVGALDRLPADLAVLIIEHDMDLVFRFARHIIVLAEGEVIFEGAPAVAANDPHVRQAYLGSYVHGRGRA